MNARPRLPDWNVLAGRPVSRPAPAPTPDMIDQCGPRLMVLLIALSCELALLVHMDWLPW